MAQLPQNLFLFWCAHEHVEFRIPEFESIAKLFKIPLKWVTGDNEPYNTQSVYLSSENPKSELNKTLKIGCLATNCQNGKNQEVVPWVILELPSEDEARKILSRSISAKYCIHLWTSANTRSELHSLNMQFIRENDKHLENILFNSNKSFKLNIDAFMKKLTSSEKHQRIESFSYIPVRGQVSLQNPDVTLVALEFYGFDHNNLPSEPFNLFFGRLIGEGQRELIGKFSLKKRCFIGNTSMDPQLSFLMTNLACVEDGSIMLDPFCGTGSLMLTASWFGAYVTGTDIDYLMLHARTRPSRVNSGKKRASDVSLRRNFVQMGGGNLVSRFLGVIVADASNPPYCENLGTFFDSIITDPPYGIREPAERVGTKRRDSLEHPGEYKVPEEYLPCHIPQKIDYDLGNIYTDLLEFASRHLVPGGRLVFWIPVNREHYAKNQQKTLPEHPDLELIANCEQVLSSHTSRRCITLQKLKSNQIHPTDCKSQASPVSCDNKMANNLQTVKETTEKFRQNFFKAQDINRQERKERIMRFGHLNIDETHQKN